MKIGNVEVITQENGDSNFYYKWYCVNDPAHKIIQDLELPNNPENWTDEHKDMFSFHFHIERVGKRLM